MEQLNNYMLNTFKSMIDINNKGFFKKPYKLIICKHDKKIIKKTYYLYKIYIYKITLKEFRQIVINNSLINGVNFIKSAINICETIEKIMKK